MNLKQLRACGFDASYRCPVPFNKYYGVRCSQCHALCINEIPTHEHGCLNQKRAERREEDET